MMQIILHKLYHHVGYAAMINATTAPQVLSTHNCVLPVSADNDRVQVGIATFDTTVHFYSLAASQSQAQMLVMPDIEDVYSLASANVVVPLQTSFQLVSHTTVEWAAHL